MVHLIQHLVSDSGQTAALEGQQTWHRGRYWKQDTQKEVLLHSVIKLYNLLPVDIAVIRSTDDVKRGLVSWKTGPSTATNHND